MLNLPQIELDEHSLSQSAVDILSQYPETSASLHIFKGEIVSLNGFLTKDGRLNHKSNFAPLQNSTKT